jgi:hypothetical protein
VWRETFVSDMENVQGDWKTANCWASGLVLIPDINGVIN